MKKGFGISFIIGVGITLGLIYLFKHKLVSWYAQKYGIQFAEKVETGIEAFVKEFLPGIDIKIGGVGELDSSEEKLAKTAWIEYSTPRWLAVGLNPSLMIAEEWPRDKEDVIRRYRAGDFGSRYIPLPLSLN